MLLSRTHPDLYGAYERTNLILVGGLSRSGTTLLSAVLDAHPDIAAGAELIPKPDTQLAGLAADIKRSRELADDFCVAGKLLRADGGNGDHASILTRCYRAGLSSGDAEETVAEFLNAGVGSLQSFKERLFFAVALMSKRASREKAAFGSFKLNAPNIGEPLDWLPETYVIALVRSPIDVVESHLRNNFPKTATQICDAWVRYCKAFRDAQRAQPDRMTCVRYEDLVSAPQDTLVSVFEKLPLEMHEETLKFHRADSAILRSRHPNTDSLREGFFSGSVGRGEGLDSDCLAEIRRICGPEMQLWNYT